MKRLIVVLLVWYCCLGAIFSQSLARQIDALIETTSFLKTSEVGIAIYDVTTGQSLYRRQSGKLYRPASTEKVITSVTALACLGEDYTFCTQLAYTGCIRNDTLKGDLYVVGGFDPEFTEKDMDMFTAAVNNAGIHYIAGDLIGDVSLTDSVYWGNGWAWDDAPELFQPYLSPLLLEKGGVKVTVIPSAKQMPPQVKIVPASDYYTLSNQAISHAPAAGRLKVTRDWLHHQNEIIVQGNAAHTYSYSLSMYPAKDFFLQTFRYKLQQCGIETKGISYGICPAEASLLSKTTRPIMEVIQRTLKKSDNLSAEALFFHVGLNFKKSCPIGFKQGREAIEHFMQNEVDSSPKNYVIVDGSGLSPYNLISPDLLIKYLKYVADNEHLFKLFYASLPIAGVDGTLQNRMKEGKAFRNVRAKTGSVTGVSTLAGYVDQTSTGHRLAFVIFNQNILRARDARMFQDKVCSILAK